MSRPAISVNLKRLRTTRGLNMEETAQKSGLTRVAYSNIENGKAEPRVSNLQKIARVLKVGIQDLIVPVPEISSVRFRAHALKSHEKSKREEIVYNVAFWLRDFNEIESMLDFKKHYKFEHSLFNQCGIPEEFAKKARKILELEEDEVINDICGLLESAGVKIYLTNSDLNKFFGFSIAKNDNGPAIGVNILENISVERQIFTVAHELGHLLMHSKSFSTNEIDEIDLEEEASDKFAGYFLMPKETFIKAWEENKGMNWIEAVLHIKRRFKVSYQTVLYRLKDFWHGEKSIWREFYQGYEKIYGERLKNYKEPEPLLNLSGDEKGLKPLDKIDFCEDRLSRLVREAFEKELISFSRAAEILKISINEMRERVNSWEMLKWGKKVTMR